MSSKPETLLKWDLWTVVKRFLTIFLPLVALVSSIVIIFYYTDIKANEKILEAHEIGDVNHQAEMVAGNIRSVVGDLMFIAEYEVHELLESDKSSQNLAEELLVFSKFVRPYDQISFLDETGMEVVRINFKDDEPYIVPENKLQSQAERDYFKNAFRLGPGEVFVSSFRPDTGSNEAEQLSPWIIRFGAPAFDSRGQKRGVVIFGLTATKFREQTTHVNTPDYSMMVFDSSGFWIKGPHPEDKQFVMGKSKSYTTFENVFSAAWQRISNAESGQFYNQDGLFTFNTVYPILEGQKAHTSQNNAFSPNTGQTEIKNYYWKIVSNIPPDVLAANLREIFDRLFLLYTILAVLLALASWFLARISIGRRRAQATLLKNKQEISRRNRELTLLNRIITASVANLQSEAILNTACHELALTFDVPQAMALLLNEAKTARVVVAEYMAEDRPSIVGKTISLDNSPLCQDLLHYKTPLIVTDAKNDPRLEPIHDLIHLRGIVSILILPLIVEEKVVGCLNLETVEPRHFSTEEMNLAWNVASQVAGALARTRMARTHQLLTTAIEQAAESVIITDTEGSILYVNPAFERVTGYSQSKVIGRSPNILKSGKHNASFYADLWATITAGQMWRGRFINKKRDGSLSIEDATVAPVHDESGVIVNYVSVQRDMTHELALEEQYHQAQKMEAVGRLAGGVAHDFNNLLTTIMGYANLSMQSLPPDAPVRSDFEGIQKAAERAANLTRQLLTFARKQVVNPSVLNLNDLILNVDKMLRRLIDADIEMVILPAPNLGWIKADAGQLEQILFNMVVNARDAMPNGGKLTIETANVTLDQDYTRRHTGVNPGNYIMLTVSDTGVGMTEEVKAHVFEPFFTTKEVGKGTGLGLSTCFGIIKQSGGHIRVFSRAGQGTTFKVYLPRTEEIVNFLPKQGKSIDLPRGTERVLLVEDEPSVRELTARTLRAQGYTVLEAANGDEALRVAYSQNGHEIHLLLTDLVMPQMGGKELAERLATLRPKIKVLFVSGYIDNTIINQDMPESGIAFLQKPFSPVALAHKVRQVLEA